MNKKLLQTQVEHTLRDMPDTRNSDITLTLRLWKQYYPQLLISSEAGTMVLIKNLFQLPREDNIKRIRAKIQNEQHLYLPTEEKVLIKRAKNSKEWKTFLGYKPTWNNTDWGIAINQFFKSQPSLF